MSKEKETKINPELKAALKNEVAPFLIGLRNEIREGNKSLKDILTRDAMAGIELIFDGGKVSALKGKDGVDGNDADPRDVYKLLKSDNAFAKKLKGEQGEPGKAGKTPVFGKDFFTAKEQKEFAYSILELARPVKGIHYKDGKDGVTTIKKEVVHVYEHMKPEAIRDSLESLKGNARLSVTAIKDIDALILQIVNSAGGSGMGGGNGDILPSQTGQAGKFLTTNGSTLSWATAGGGSAAGVLGDVQINTPLGTFGVVGGARIVTTGLTRGTNAFDWQGGVQTNTSHVASGLRAITIGADNTASTADAIAIGNTNVAQVGAGALAVGRSNQSNGTNAISYGISNISGNTSSISIGLGNNISHGNAMGYGQGNQSNGDFAVLFGYSNQAGTVGMAFGVQNTMGAGGLGVGNGNTGGGNGIAVGLTNQVNGNESGVFGMQNGSSSDKNYIIGYSSSDDGTAVESMSLGHFNALKAGNTYIFGNSITNNIANSMMLGISDIAKIFLKLDDLTQSGVQVGINTLTPNDTTALHVVGLADSGAGMPTSAIFIENAGSLGSGLSARIGVDDSVSGIFMGNYANFFSDTGGAGFDYWGNGNSYFGNTATIGTLFASGATISNTLNAKNIVLAGQSLGTEILRISASATNDDPTVSFRGDRTTTTSGVAAAFPNNGVVTPSNSITIVEATFIGVRTGGSAGTTGDGAGYKIIGVYKNIAGTVTLLGTLTTVHGQESQAGFDGTLVISGTQVKGQVTGATNNNMVWHIIYEHSSVAT